MFYVAAIVTGFLNVLLLMVRESRPSLLLVREVKQLRKMTGDESLEALNPDSTPDLRTFVRTALLRPLRLFFTEPIVFACSIMQGACVALIYLFTEALPPIYQSMGLAPAPASLPFFAIALGCLLNILTRLWDTRVAKKQKEKGEKPLPENKITGLFIAAPALAAGLWWFAWVIPPSTTHLHWFVSCVPLFRDEMVLVTSKTHPRLNGMLLESDIYREQHAVVALDRYASFSQPCYDTPDKQACVAYQVMAMVSVLNIVSQTHLVAIAPRWLVEEFAEPLNLRIMPLPLNLNSRTCYLSWHEAAGRDKGHQWMEELLVDICQR